jgi:hypothetical protein
MTYFDMSESPCVEKHRLELFWSILGECIEERKQFIFQCKNDEEADELEKLTWTLVFQINDIWKVSLDKHLVVTAIPPNMSRQ